MLISEIPDLLIIGYFSNLSYFFLININDRKSKNDQCYWLYFSFRNLLDLICANMLKSCLPSLVHLNKAKLFFLLSSERVNWNTLILISRAIYHKRTCLKHARQPRAFLLCLSLIGFRKSNRWSYLNGILILNCTWEQTIF